MHQGKVCEVIRRAGNAKGKYFNYFNIQPRDGSEPYHIDMGKTEFQRMMGEQALVTTEEGQEVFM